MNRILSILAVFGAFLLPLSAAESQAIKVSSPAITQGDATVTNSDGVVEIHAPVGKAAVVRLLDMPASQVTAPVYAIEGEVAYAGVAGDGYLEMWSDFGSQQRYFSRTLGATGPMSKITGTSSWRPFLLPFDTTGAPNAPISLEVNVVLPSGGTVSLRNLGFQNMTPNQLHEALMRGFGTPPASGVAPTPPAVVFWIGGIVAGVAGVLGTAVAVFYRRSLRKAMAGAMTGVGFGFAMLVVGLSSPLLQWPFSVFYPLMLGGVVISALFLGLAWSLRRYWQQEELRRIAAMDLG
jgi:hypothetical protein